MRAPFLTLCLLALVSPAAPAQPASETASDVVTRVAASLGSARFTPEHPALKATGKALRYGVDADIELILDGRGRFRISVGGPVPEVRAFDGSEITVKDFTGAGHRVLMQDRDLALVAGWIATGYWTVKPDLFDITLLADQGNDKEAVLALKPRDGLVTVNLHIDRATWLPMKATHTVRGQTHVYTFDQFTDGPGLKLPRKTSHTARGFKSQTDWSQVQEAGSLGADTFRISTRGSDLAVLDAQKPAGLTVKRTASGHLLVKPTIAGQDVGWFIFDTGAGFSVLEKRLINKLGLKRFGEIPVGGVAGGPVKSSFVRPASIELGPVTLRDPICIELDLAMISLGLGEKVSGIIGYPLLQSIVADIDCATPAITLHDPASYKLPEGVAWQQLVIDNFHPHVKATYEGDRSAWFLLDTGDTGTVSFYTPTVRREKLLEGRKTGVAMQGGVGGVARARTGTLDWFELGGHRFERPDVAFSETEQGAFANAYAAGNLGQGVFKPFRLVFDFGHERIAFVPTAVK